MLARSLAPVLLAAGLALTMNAAAAQPQSRQYAYVGAAPTEPTVCGQLPTPSGATPLYLGCVEYQQTTSRHAHIGVRDDVLGPAGFRYEVYRLVPCDQFWCGPFQFTYELCLEDEAAGTAEFRLPAGCDRVSVYVLQGVKGTITLVA